MRQVSRVVRIAAARARRAGAQRKRDRSRRRLLEAIGEARLPSQPHQLTLEQQQAVEAQVFQRVTRDLCRDEGVTVAVAAHPGAQAELGQILRRAEAVGVEPHVGPRLAQPAIEHGEDFGKHRVQVVHDVPPLGRHIGLLQEDLAGPPQQREHGLDLLADDALLVRRPHLVLALDQQ